MARMATQMIFGLRTRSVLGGSVLGVDDLGGARVRRSHRCRGATRRCLDVQSKLLLVLGCAIEALAGAWMCDRSSRRFCYFSLSSIFLGLKSIVGKIQV